MGRTLKQVAVRVPLPRQTGGAHRDKRLTNYCCTTCGSTPQGMQLVMTVVHGKPVRVCASCATGSEEER